jgi:hypothetical protein
MAVYKEPTEHDKHGHPTAFAIKQIQYVTDGDVKTDKTGAVVLDDNRKPVILPRPMIKGQFDRNQMLTIATVKYTDPEAQQIELEKVAEAVETLMNDVQPQCDNSGFEIRHNVSGNSLFISYREPDSGGVSQEFAVVSLIASGLSFDKYFGARLCAVFDKDGEKALEHIQEMKRSSGQKSPGRVPA